MENIDFQELSKRYYDLLSRYTNLSMELAKKLEEFGRIRQELQFIVSEFANKNKDLTDPEELKKKVEQFLLENMPQNEKKDQ